MFTGLIFDHLKERFGLQVDYEIKEANHSDRVGGRLFTYVFPGTDKAEHNHQYYDVGAMRFPKIDIMSRTYDLFKILDMTEVTDSTDDIKKAPDGSLIPYYLTGKNDKTPSLYNGIQIINEEPVTASANAFNISNIPAEYGSELIKSFNFG